MTHDVKKQSEINLYNVLGIENTASAQDIKNAYRKLIPEHHPDRGGNPEIFELITNAYNILHNNETRAEYDKIIILNKHASSDHMKLKQSSQEYFHSVENVNSDEFKQKYQSAYQKYMHEKAIYNQKHQFDPKEQHKVDSDTILQRVKELELLRELDGIECVPEPVVETDSTGKINLAKFNAIFDAVYKNNSDIVLHSDIPNAYANDNNEFTNYSSAYDNIHSDIECINNVSHSHIPNKNVMRNIKDADYVTQHNKKTEDYDKTIEQMINEYQNETDLYNKKTMSDYDTITTHYKISEGLDLDPNINLDFDPEDAKQQYNLLLEYINNKNKDNVKENV